MRGVYRRGKYWVANYKNKAKCGRLRKFVGTEQEAIELRKKWEKEYGIPSTIRKDYRGKKIGNLLIIDYVPKNHAKVLVKNLITNEFQERALNQIVIGKVTGIPKSIASRESHRHEGVGTSFRKSSNKWRAYININGKRKYLGYFLTQEEAIAARKTAEQKYFN